MLTRDGKVKLLDLGIARITASDPEDSTQVGTDTIVAAGTPAYMAPERLGGRPADARTDVYSVGVLLYELLTGKRPYSAPDIMSLAVTIATQPTPRVSGTRSDVPPVLDDLIARAMAKDPATRYASAAELHDGVTRVRDTLSGLSPETLDDTYQHWRPRLITIVAAIAVLAIGGWLMRPMFRRAPALAPVATTVAIPPVINASTDQADLDEVGSLLQSVLSRNLAILPGVTIVSATPPASNGGTAATGQPPPAPDYTVSLTVRRAVSGMAVDVGLIRKGDAHPLPSEHFEGDALGLLRFATERVATALEDSNRGGPTVASAVRARMRQLPTADGDALRSYLQGRTALDTSEAAETDQAAADLFDNAIKRDASFAFAHAGLSQAFTSRAKNTEDASWLDRATQAAEQALAMDPACDQAYLASALAFRAAGKKDNAVLEARKAVALTPDSDDAHRILGLALSDQGQPDVALTELRAAVTLRPRHWINRYALGRSLLVHNKYQEGIDELQQVKRNLPAFESAYVNLGYAYNSIGNWDEAVGNLEMAVTLNPKDHYALNNLATAYFWDRKYQQALASYKEAIKHDPESHKLFMNLGDTYQAIGNAAEASAAYEHAIGLADRKQAAAFNPATEAIAAKCLAELRKFDLAENRVRQALSQDAGNGEVVYKFAVVYALWNKADKSQDTADKALDKLEQAFKLGYHPVWVRDDPDLRSLSTQPRFKRLIADTTR
jgi:tetratricopeptide (TPR) repeat protein